MLFGVHVSIAGGIENAPENAAETGCDVFQMFSRSPRGGQPMYTAVSFPKFKANMKKFKQKECYIHTPYYINLASANNRIRYGSISAIHAELDVGSKINARHVMTHLGSAKDFPQKEAMKLVIDGINKIFENYHGTTELLLEISAGSGQIIGDTFEELGEVLKKIKNKNVGVCFDTCHAFASGYDLRTKKSIDATLADFDKHIGLDKLKLLHLNDSMVDFNSKKDRHADIGKGKLGEEAIKLIINHPKLKNLNAILETPGEDPDYKTSLKLLRSWLNKEKIL